MRRWRRRSKSLSLIRPYAFPNQTPRLANANTNWCIASNSRLHRHDIVANIKLARDAVSLGDN